MFFTNWLNYIVVHTSFVTVCDAAEPWQVNCQDPATPMFEGMIFFHNYLLFFIIFIGIFVVVLLYKIIITFGNERL